MNPELIEKFFRKECSPQQAKKVALYLKENPDVLEKYLSNTEWNDVQLHKIFSDEFWDDALKKIRYKNKAHTISIIIKKTTAVAASVILIISAFYYLYTPSKKVNVTASLQTIKPANTAEQKFITNTTGKAIDIVLQDSSIVKLAPASSVHYIVPFQNNKRDIYLDGEAYFKVSKNKAKPFTVYASGIATTALGTSFNIKTNKKKNTINVKLYTGKVVIRATQNFSGWLNDVYLLPGEQMQFNKTLKQVALSKINSKEINAGVTADNNKTTNNTNNIALSFNNTSLHDVFNKISAYYEVKIVYDTTLVDTIKFTGVVMKTDSPPVILNIITQMNNLEMFKNNDEYIISKPKQ